MSEGLQPGGGERIVCSSCNGAVHGAAGLLSAGSSGRGAVFSAALAQHHLCSFPSSSFSYHYFLCSLGFINRNEVFL